MNSVVSTSMAPLSHGDEEPGDPRLEAQSFVEGRNDERQLQVGRPWGGGADGWLAPVHPSILPCPPVLYESGRPGGLYGRPAPMSPVVKIGEYETVAPVNGAWITVEVP